MTPEDALDAARSDLDGCGFPAFTAVAFLAGGPVFPPITHSALRPAVGSAGALRGIDEAAPIYVIGCDRQGEETQWTVYDEHGERRLLTLREVPEATLHRMLDVL